MAKRPRESTFQSKVIQELNRRFDGCIIMKNDSGYRQGFPDLTVLHKDRWAALECKRSEKEKHQPNQNYYVEKLNEMSYARFIFPENMESVMGELEQLFKRRRGKD